MSEQSAPPVITIYEMAFASSDKTDAILVVDGKKLHVNKTLLSCHSDYFNTLFNSDFKEKSMQEIPIEDVNFEDFATVLSLVHPNPIEPTIENSERLLQLADRFFLPAAKRHVELSISCSRISRIRKLELADKYNLEILLEHILMGYSKKEDFNNMYNATIDFTDHTRSKLFQRYFYLVDKAKDRSSNNSSYGSSGWQ
ncbi:hypothetical protein GCK72_020964 [Caenorhabditis remanei]|uniref:BTB domain-containing protein n=1 Tax=Caenorhabditis remanei TaxID=31234 RepID=A0A6A5GI96_CAERE|nr:hypothetical protein GCK72_020964 [Caenorhabditis remanei]KAF1754403.1 hypothetical protein GCK72_020964 [Caenorhabditis remanei]